MRYKPHRGWLSEAVRGGVGLAAIIAAVIGIGLAGRAINPAFVNDQLEMLEFSRSWQWTYDEQNPVYAWIAHLALDASGGSIFALEAIKYTLVAVMLAALAATGERLERGAGLVTLALAFTIPTIGADALHEITHSAGLLAATAASAMVMVRALDRPGARLWLWLGLIWAAGLTFKPTMIVVAAAQLVAVASLPPAHRSALLPPMLKAIAVMLALNAPVYAIMLAHAETVRDGAAEFFRGDAFAARLRGAGDMLSSPISEGGLIMAAALVGWYRQVRPRALLPAERLALTTTAVFLLAFALAVLISGASVVRDRWLAPGLMLMAPVAGAMLVRTLTARQARIAAALAVGFVICMALVAAAQRV